MIICLGSDERGHAMAREKSKDGWYFVNRLTFPDYELLNKQFQDNLQPLMSVSPETELLKQLSSELVPDLTKALKIFKSRVSLILRIIKQPFDDYEGLLRLITEQECELISKYQTIDPFLLSGYQMEFQRLFSRMIESFQLEKKNQNLQLYISQVETIIYETITNPKSDYIMSLSRIYGKGRGITRIIINQDIPGGKTPKTRPSVLAISKTQKRTVESKDKKEKQKYGINSPSLKILAGLDLDWNYRKNSYLYTPTHQEETLQEMSERNKWILSDISMYKRAYTENTQRQQRKVGKGKRLIDHPTSMSMSDSQISPAILNPESDNLDSPAHFKNNCNTTTIGSFKNHRAISMSKQNKKYKDYQGKTSTSFRQTQMNQTFSRQITPKKIFFCFNKLALRPVEDTKPAQFSIRKKSRQIFQNRIRTKQSLFQILVEGKKIEEDMLEIIDIKRKISAKVNSNLFV